VIAHGRDEPPTLASRLQYFRGREESGAAGDR
jgi:hypothetical protein